MYPKRPGELAYQIGSCSSLFVDLLLKGKTQNLIMRSAAWPDSVH